MWKINFLTAPTRKSCFSCQIQGCSCCIRQSKNKDIAYILCILCLFLVVIRVPSWRENISNKPRRNLFSNNIHLFHWSHTSSVKSHTDRRWDLPAVKSLFQKYIQIHSNLHFLVVYQGPQMRISFIAKIWCNDLLTNKKYACFGGAF